MLCRIDHGENAYDALADVPCTQDLRFCPYCAYNVGILTGLRIASEAATNLFHENEIVVNEHLKENQVA